MLKSSSGVQEVLLISNIGLSSLSTHISFSIRVNSVSFTFYSHSSQINPKCYTNLCLSSIDYILLYSLFALSYRVLDLDTYIYTIYLILQFKYKSYFIALETQNELLNYLPNSYSTNLANDNIYLFLNFNPRIVYP